MTRSISPTKRILDWFDELDASVKPDIAFLISSFATEDSSHLPMEADKIIPYFRDWLHKDDFRSQFSAWRAMTFSTAFDALFSDRFDIQGWSETEKRDQRMLESLKNAEDLEEQDRARMQKTFEEMMARRPSQEDQWIPVGVSWKKLRDDFLKPADLVKDALRF